MGNSHFCRAQGPLQTDSGVRGSTVLALDLIILPPKPFSSLLRVMGVNSQHFPVFLCKTDNKKARGFKGPKNWRKDARAVGRNNRHRGHSHCLWGRGCERRDQASFPWNADGCRQTGSCLPAGWHRASWQRRATRCWSWPACQMTLSSSRQLPRHGGRCILWPVLCLCYFRS